MDVEILSRLQFAGTIIAVSTIVLNNKIRHCPETSEELTEYKRNLQTDSICEKFGR